MTHMRYGGFNFAKEIFADNIDFYKDCLSNPGFAASIGVSEEDAKRGLELLKRFPPNKEHNRLVAHKVEVYAIKNPGWQKRGELLVPKGKLECVLSIDFGDEIKRICEEELVMQENLGVVTIDLGDGTSVTGPRIKKSNYKGPPYQKTIPNEHLNISFNSSSYQERGNFCYSFDIKRTSITAEQPKEFHIKKYVLLDGENVGEDTEVARARFKPDSDGKTPLKFGHLVFTSN